MNDERAYWQLGYKGVRMKLIQPWELRTIARVNHRKQNYWSRHYDDLLSILCDRLSRKLQAQQASSVGSEGGGSK